MLIWQGKKARCSHSLLTKYKSAGGMEMVDIAEYHTVTHFDQLKFWFSTCETPLWVDIEHYIT